jgi:hypothetical protein
MAQEVECLLSKLKALSSNSGTEKRKKDRKERKEVLEIFHSLCSNVMIMFVVGTVYPFFMVS